ncbi:TPA: hypothetical protein EYP13_03180, partial [Candidatus Micrarchaeota archaeon]|nr:hypothetical protein [Candidatus Micrarchaeota archaeon]
MREELSELSKKLVALTDLMRKNTSLLKAHSGDVAELISRFHALDEKVACIEEEVKKAPSLLAELQKTIERDLEELREKVVKGIRELRKHRDSDIAREYKALKEALSVIHAELAGIIETVKKYDTTAKLEELSRRLDEIHAAVEEGKEDHSTISRELADIEEQLARISSVVSEADVRAVKSRLEDIYRTVDGIAERVKDARAILSEDELKEIVRDLEALRAQVRKLRDAGLGDELDEIRGKIKKLRSIVEAELEAMGKGKVHHLSIMSHHSEAKRLVVPVAEVSSVLRSIVAAKETSARKMKAAASNIAKKTGSTHAHIIASHSDRIVRTAKAMKGVERLIKKIQKRLDKIEAEASSKRGAKAKDFLSDIAKRDLV